jgi:CRP-like cAMP-binding protein
MRYTRGMRDLGLREERSTMDTPREIDIADLELFADCTKAELRQIRSLTTYLRIPKDRVLIKEGTRAQEFIIINSGTARISRETDDGLTTVAEVGTGKFLGEMALLTGSPRNATATAATDLGVLVSSASEFRSILRIAPKVADKVFHTSMERAATVELAPAVAA